MPSLVQGKRPRITYQAVCALHEKLGPRSATNADWRLFASRLDQTLFTSSWIELTESKCLPTGESAMRMVLQAWQEKFRDNEDVPVQKIYGTLLQIGRSDAASVVEMMTDEGTFLDWPTEPPSAPTTQSSYTSFHPRHCCSSQGPSPNNSEEFGPGKAASFTQDQRGSLQHSPQETSFYGWTEAQMSDTEMGKFVDETLLAQLNQPRHQGSPYNTTRSVCQDFTHNMNMTPTSQPVQEPQNFHRSTHSLDSSRSGFADAQSDPNPNPNPHQQRNSDYVRATWPRGYKDRQASVNQPRQAAPIQDGIPPLEIMPQDPQYAQSGCCSISPLRSFPPDNTITTGASPVPVCESRKDVSWFITYAYKSYEKGLELGKALKAQGHDVMVDRKSRSFDSEVKCQEVTTQFFNTMTYIIIIYDTQYLQEIEGLVPTPLNTRFIYRLMVRQFQRQGGRNFRFIPIIDHSRIDPYRVPPLFRHYPERYAKYLHQVLELHNSSKTRLSKSKEVSIERIMYTSSGH